MNFIILTCLFVCLISCISQYAYCTKSGESGSPSRNSGFKRPRSPTQFQDLNLSPPREEQEHRPASPTGSASKASASAHHGASHPNNKGKEQRKYSITPSLSSSYSDSIKYYPTHGKIKTGEYGSQERTPSPKKSRQRSPTPDSARKIKDRSPTPESRKRQKVEEAGIKQNSGGNSPKGEGFEHLGRNYPGDPGISGTKKVVINSPLVLSSSSQHTHGYSGRSSTLTPITRAILEDEAVYRHKFGHSPPPYESHSDTRSYDYRGGYASSPGSIQQHLLQDSASSRSRSRSPSPTGRQISQASTGHVAASSSHGGYEAGPASSAQSVHHRGSPTAKSITVARSSLRREGTTTPPSPSSSSNSSRSGSSPNAGAVAASPAHSGHSVGSHKSSKRGGSH